MRRYKYTLSYDSEEPENELVCAALDALGNKRSAVIKALIEDAIKRYGNEVFNRENVKILLYLIGHTPHSGVLASVQTGMTGATDFQMPFQTAKKRRVKKSKESGRSGAEKARQEEKAERITGQDPPEVPTHSPAVMEPEPAGESDQMRGSLLDFLNTGMFGEE